MIFKRFDRGLAQPLGWRVLGWTGVADSVMFQYRQFLLRWRYLAMLCGFDSVEGIPDTVTIYQIVLWRAQIIEAERRPIVRDIFEHDWSQVSYGEFLEAYRELHAEDQFIPYVRVPSKTSPSPTRKSIRKTSVGRKRHDEWNAETWALWNNYINRLT